MLKHFVHLMIRWRGAVLIAAALWAICGTWIAWVTPIDALPDLSDNQVLVYTPWLDHDPPEIEAKVTQPLSKTLNDIQGLRSLRGSSDVGFSLIHCIFDDAVRFDEARRRVNAALSTQAMTLPLGVLPQLASEGIPTGQIVWYTLSGIGTDLVELRRWQQEFVGPRLSRLSGVAEVSSVGGMQPEISVAANPDSLSQVGLSIGELEKQLRSIPSHLRDREPLGSLHSASPDSSQELAEYPIQLPDGTTNPLSDLCRLTLQPAPRLGVFEKDGSELVAGIVHLRAGENPLRVTETVLDALRKLGDELPSHLRLSPSYDRSPLIRGAVATLSRTLVEAVLVTALGIWLLMRHLRTSIVIGLTVPLSVLGAFIGMSMITRAGLTLNINIMSLAGIAISIGVLVDSSIVIVDNITHTLQKQFGDRPVVGDTSELVADATVRVARPAIFAILIMLVSFLPIFALEGIDGKMYRPLVWTKTLTLLSVMALAITVVPALSSYLIRGRLRCENESSIVRSISQVYRPCLLYLFEQPWPLFLMLGGIVIAAVAVTGHDWLLRIATVASVGSVWWFTKRRSTSLFLSLGLIGLALTMQATVNPIRLALRLPLDEGMVMDMPITIPRMTASQAINDLKARNMILCRFPEVRMVTGKAGRADTAFDPAPMDMIETMIEFRSHESWPRRRLLRTDARRHAAQVIREMGEAGLVELLEDEATLIDPIVDASLQRFDSVQREFCWQMLQPFEKKLSQELMLAAAQELAKQWVSKHVVDSPVSDLQLRTLGSKVEWTDQLRLAQQLDANSVQIILRQLCKVASGELSIRLTEKVASAEIADAKFRHALLAKLQSISTRLWKEFVSSENQMLLNRAGRSWTQIVVTELCERCTLIDTDFADTWDQILAARHANTIQNAQHHDGSHTGMPSISKLPIITPHRVYDALVEKLSNQFSSRLWLWSHSDESLSGPSGELDRALQMPGWANVWTRPIQNRIDMLATGVNSEVGVRVLGGNLESVVESSEVVAEILRQVPGAANVLCDPIRDKDYADFVVDRDRAGECRLDMTEIRLAIDAATRGYVIPFDSVNSLSIPVRFTVLPSRGIGQGLLDTSLPFRESIGNAENTPSLRSYALREFVSLHHRDGPATIKSENGQLRNYVRLNVRDRDASQWVQEAKRELAKIQLPDGISLEWTGQFEHASKTRYAMLWIIPCCVIAIGLLLFGVFWDFTDAMLMLLSIPGALAGATLCQWLMGFPFSLAVCVGYIACFGMAAATSMVMLVYLRQALADAGSFEALSLTELKTTVIDGAVHRLRPKLLTETTMILGLVPIMWSTGIGADVIRPMAAPVLGGILIADEVVDLLIPVLFYKVRQRRWSQCNTHKQRI
ncbi:MAG: efflux RND transporter permease subunit [Planctomycetota bacterium]|nr:efflux RND transporter permease subunit [Planctomycetota bacterium]